MVFRAITVLVGGFNHYLHYLHSHKTIDTDNTKCHAGFSGWLSHQADCLYFFNYATCYLERVHGNMTQNGHVWPSICVCQDIQRGGENMNHLLNRLLPLRIMPIVVGGMMIVFDLI